MSQPAPPDALYPPAAPPPPPYPAAPQHDGRWVLSYQDFPPNQLAPGGLFNTYTYEPFSALVVRANQWLQQNPAIKVKVCESVETRVIYGMGMNANTSSYYEYSHERRVTYLRSLRIWVQPKEAGDNPAPQQLGYLNVMPAPLSNGLFSMQQYATYSDTISSLNQMLQGQPLPGRILNVETVDVKAGGTMSGMIDPDQSCWFESGTRSTFFLNVIRLFYEVGPPCHEQIGSVDFVPSAVSSSMLMTEYESLSSLLQKANQWIQQNATLPVCNIQTLEFKFHNTWGGGLDSQRSFYYESETRTERFFSIIRVYYVCGGSTRPPVQAISYKTFIPAQISGGGLSLFPTYEPLNQCMARAMAWLKLTNAKVIGCETQAVRLNQSFGESVASSTERTHFYDRNNTERYLFVIRVFLDGFYQEPPPELLPPVMSQPQNATTTDCCALS